MLEMRTHGHGRSLSGSGGRGWRPTVWTCKHGSHLAGIRILNPHCTYRLADLEFQTNQQIELFMEILTNQLLELDQFL